MDVSQLAKMYGISYSVLYSRLFRMGWPLDRALTTPVGREQRRKVDINPEDLPPLPKKETT